MPRPRIIPDNIKGLSLPESINEDAYRDAQAQERVLDWRGLVEWSPDLPVVTYDAYTEIESDSGIQYSKYGAIILGLNGGNYNGPIIGWLGINVLDEIRNEEVVVAISVLMDRNENGSPFRYSAKFVNRLTSMHHFTRQRFFPDKMKGFLI